MDICFNFNRAISFLSTEKEIQTKIPHGCMDTLWTMVPRKYGKLSTSGAKEHWHHGGHIGVPKQ